MNVRIWEENNVWNAEVVDESIAAFGETPQEAFSNLIDRIESHLEVLKEKYKGKKIDIVIEN